MSIRALIGVLIVLDRDFALGIRAITEELGILMIIDETIP